MAREMRTHDWLTPQVDVKQKYFDDVTGDNWVSFNDERRADSAKQ